MERNYVSVTLYIYMIDLWTCFFLRGCCRLADVTVLLLRTAYRRRNLRRVAESIRRQDDILPPTCSTTPTAARCLQRRYSPQVTSSWRHSTRGRRNLHSADAPVGLVRVVERVAVSDVNSDGSRSRWDAACRCSRSAICLCACAGLSVCWSRLCAVQNGWTDRDSIQDGVDSDSDWH